MAVQENVPLGYNETIISASDPDGPSDGEVFYVFEGNASVRNSTIQWIQWYLFLYYNRITLALDVTLEY